MIDAKRYEMLRRYVGNIEDQYIPYFDEDAVEYVYDMAMLINELLIDVEVVQPLRHLSQQDLESLAVDVDHEMSRRVSQKRS